ncbi:MAG: alanine racemase [Alicyclobacillus sp.]|nr:alanine racemase [Alicyclobacillus sp.]
MNIDSLTTPAVIVDLDIVDRNIRTFEERLAPYGIAHRPHIKTHKSVEMARRQLAAGAIGITCAKLGEAEVFAEGGVTDILLAYPLVGKDKLARFAALHQHVRMMTTVDSLEVARGLADVGAATGKPVDVLVELDLGMHRCGVQPQDAATFAEAVRALGNLHVVGVMEYNALARTGLSIDGLRGALRQESDAVAAVVEDLRRGGFDIQIVSAGSTVAGMLPDALHGITEVRSGTYIYQDATAMDIGFATEADCAIRVVTTVVSTPVAGRATVDAGSKTLTSDHAVRHPGYGVVVGHPDVTVCSLSEEHGCLEFDPQQTSFAIGDRIQIIPNHACVISNLTDGVYGVRGGEVVGPIRIDARGRNR